MGNNIFNKNKTMQAPRAHTATMLSTQAQHKAVLLKIVFA